VEPVPEWVSTETRLILERFNVLEETLGLDAGPTLHWRVGPITWQENRPRATSAQIGRTDSMADLVLTADQQARLAASGVDSDGNPVDLTGSLTYGVDNTDVLTLTDNGDGTALVVTTGPTGSALVTATGDGVIGSLAVDVVAGDVSSIAISATAEPQGTP
jgi:hypothetical protein